MSSPFIGLSTELIFQIADLLLEDETSDIARDTGYEKQWTVQQFLMSINGCEASNCWRNAVKTAKNEQTVRDIIKAEKARCRAGMSKEPTGGDCCADTMFITAVQGLRAIILTRLRAMIPTRLRAMILKIA